MALEADFSTHSFTHSIALQATM